ncbi:GNAT family N-acetyltransferase, partial [Caballeronia sp. CLC5]|nr:GNAT family N-acetyltransferase [Caballeronia sp. CLC5]
LARDVRMRGKGFGEVLAVDAIRRILGAAETLAVLAIIVDAKDERAAAFYEGLGFAPFPRRPNRLFLLASSAGRGLEKM